MSDEVLDIEQLARIPGVLDGSGGFDLAPDGRTVALSWNISGQWELYLLNLDYPSEPRLITAPEVHDAKVAPRWSPDGRLLAYAQDHDGDERYDFYVYDPQTGQHRNVTPDTPEYISPSFSWSPDGARLALSATREDRFGIWTLPLAGGNWTRVSAHPHSDDDPRWSPRGDWIAFTAYTEGQHVALFLARPDGSEVREVRGPRGEPLFVQSPEWAPDGARIAFAGGPRDVVDIGVYDVASSALTWVETGKHECATPAWSRDGGWLAYSVNSNGDLRLVVANLAGGAKRDLSIGPGLHEGMQWIADGRGVLCVFNGPGHTSDLWLVDLENGAPRQLTQSMPANLAAYPFVAPTHVYYPSLDGHTQVPALLYRPQVAARGGGRPAVIHIHGGPAWQRMDSWYPEIQWLLSRGCVVLCPNYRGSTGYGRAFMEANRFVMGDADLQDVAGAVEFLVRNELADADRIGVTGWSYGGYMTMMCLTMHPGKFAAGSAGIPFMNWILAADEERDDLRHWDRENMGDPVKDAERLRAASPIHFMDRIRAPVQFIGGAHDPRCPISQVYEAQEVMQRLGKPFETVIYPDEGHGFLKIENQVDAERRWAEFLGRHLDL